MAVQKSKVSKAGSARARTGSGKGFPVVVGIVDDATAACAVKAAREICEGRPGAVLHLCHVVAPRGRAPAQSEDLSAGERVAQRVAKKLMGGDASRSKVHVVLGKPAEALSQLAVDLDARLLVVGTHRRAAVARIALGSVARKLLSLAPCSVLVGLPQATAKRAKSARIEPAPLPGEHLRTLKPRRRVRRNNAPPPMTGLMVPVHGPRR